MRLFPLRQMAGTLYSHKAPVRQCFHHGLALVKGNIFVLFSPDDEDRPGVAADPLKLGGLVHIRIAGDFQEAGAAETLELHLISVTRRPIREMLRMKEIRKLIVRPESLIEKHREVAPYRR